MKTFPMLLAACLLTIAGWSSAQTVQRLQVLPLKIAQPAQASTPVAQATEFDQEKVALREEVRQLRVDNRRLEAEKQALAGQVTDFTRLGGSQVHAYCPSPATSRNTAGAESDCAASGGYTCEPVSGLCRSSCQTSDMCTGGFTCDTGAQRCVRTG